MCVKFYWIFKFIDICGMKVVKLLSCKFLKDGIDIIIIEFILWNEEMFDEERFFVKEVND